VNAFPIGENPVKFRLTFLLLLALILSACSSDPRGELSLALHLQMTGLDFPIERVREYCIEALSERGIRVRNDVSVEEAERGKIPTLIIRLSGPEEDIATRLDYKTETTVEYWDTVLLKRNPAIEIYRKVFGNTGSAHFRSEDHVFYTSWAGVQDRIRSAVDSPSRIILVLATGTPEDLIKLVPESVRKQMTR